MKTKPLHLLLIAGIVVSLSLCVLQINIFYSNRKQLDEKENRLTQLDALQTTLGRIEQQLAQRKLLEDRLFKMIPKGTASVFDLMHELTSIGTAMGLRNIAFGIEDKAEDTSQQKRARSRNLRRIDVRKEKIKPKILEQEVDVHYFAMDFDAGYQETAAFLNRLLELDRVVLVEKAQIQRQKDILPRQHVTLTLVTYSFSFAQ